jgi:TonB family protein
MRWITFCLVGALSAACATAPTLPPGGDWTGWTKPKERVKGCVGNSVRIPRDLVGVTGSVLITFRVRADGTHDSIKVRSQIDDARIGRAMWAAVKDCSFEPGLDPSGKPADLPMEMKVRFAGE